LVPELEREKKKTTKVDPDDDERDLDEDTDELLCSRSGGLRVRFGDGGITGGVVDEGGYGVSVCTDGCLLRTSRRERERR
jgi:hypothetical protein